MDTLLHLESVKVQLKPVIPANPKKLVAEVIVSTTEANDRRISANVPRPDVSARQLANNLLTICLESANNLCLERLIHSLDGEDYACQTPEHGQCQVEVSVKFPNEDGYVTATGTVHGAWLDIWDCFKLAENLIKKVEVACGR